MDEAYFWTYGLRLCGAIRYRSIVFLSYLDGRNSNIIDLHSSVSFTAQLRVRELLNHVWFNNLPIYDLGFTKKNSWIGLFWLNKYFNFWCKMIQSIVEPWYWNWLFRQLRKDVLQIISRFEKGQLQIRMWTQILYEKKISRSILTCTRFFLSNLYLYMKF